MGPCYFGCLLSGFSGIICLSPSVLFFNGLSGMFCLLSRCSVILAPRVSRYRIGCNKSLGRGRLLKDKIFGLKFYKIGGDLRVRVVVS